jgi:GTP-binding protein EngB required for normal cell division
LDNELNRLKDEIISSLAIVEDAHHRVVLTLMIRIIETQERFTNQVFTKFDRIIQDEERIKNIALNGFSDQHADHHRWVAIKVLAERDNDKDFKKFLRGVISQFIVYVVLFIAGLHASKIAPQLFGGK